MEIGSHRDIKANAHIKIGSNSYEKVETFKYLSFYSQIKILFRRKLNVDLKQEIHVIIQSKHSCLLDFFLRI